MSMRIGSSISASLLVLLCACGSPQKKTAKALESGSAWAAATAMCVEERETQSVPDRYVDEFFKNALKEMSTAAETARKSSTADARMLDETRDAIQSAKNALEGRDAARERAVVGKLKDLSRQLDARSAAVDQS